MRMTGNALLQQYKTGPGFWDEMCNNGQIRPEYSRIAKTLSETLVDSLHYKDKLAGELFMNQGITFTVYTDDEGIERIFPFDIIPRIITGKEWDIVELGIKQRITALNLFLKDIYSDRQILHDKIIPADLIAS